MLPRMKGIGISLPWCLEMQMFYLGSQEHLSRLFLRLKDKKVGMREGGGFFKL